MKAVFPGSFDPFTLAHRRILVRALKLFPHVQVLITYNHLKDQAMFAIEHRRIMVEKSIAELDVKDRESISIHMYDGLLADYVSDRGLGFIVRGLRDSADLEYERKLEQFNRLACPAETVYLACESQDIQTSSTLVRMFFKTGKPDLAVDYLTPEALAYAKALL